MHLLPSYHGLENENPNKHLKEFHVVCLSMKTPDVMEDIIKLKAFPFSLKYRAKDLLYSLPPGSVTTWNQMARLFLDKFFAASRAATLRREICSIKQRDVETLPTNIGRDSNIFLLVAHNMGFPNKCYFSIFMRVSSLWRGK